MLRQQNRFHGHGSLKYVYRNGRMVRSKFFGLRYVYNPHREHDRVAIVVSKKVAKAAPKRNRIRRRLFEAIRSEWPQLMPHHDIIINVYSPEPMVMPFSALKKELIDVLDEAHLLKTLEVDSQDSR